MIFISSEFWEAVLASEHLLKMMFVRRNSSIPFANRAPKLKFNASLLPTSVHTVPEEGERNVQPRKSNLKPSNFEHPILVDNEVFLDDSSDLDFTDYIGMYNPGLNSRNTSLCILMNVKLMGSTNVIEEFARTSIDVLTFPNPFKQATKVEIFGRIKACFVIILTGLGEMKKVTTPSEGISLVAKDPALKQIIENLQSTRKFCNDLCTQCKKLVRVNRREFRDWSTIVHRVIESDPHERTTLDYRLYSDMSTSPPVEDYKTYERVIGYDGGSISIDWSPESYQVDTETNFLRFNSSCQLEFLQELSRFTDILVEKCALLMRGCVDRWDADMASPSISEGYAHVKTAIIEMERMHQGNAGIYLELKASVRMLHYRKLDLFQASVALEESTKHLSKQIQELITFVKQTYRGDKGPREWSHFCGTCNPYIDLDELIQCLTDGMEKWDIQMKLPLIPAFGKLM